MASWDPFGGNLLFVISQPRSGSTLLQKILGSHSFIHTVSEPWIALHPIFGRRDTGIATDYGSRLALTGLEEFLGNLRDGEEVWWESVRLMLGHLYGRALEQSGRRLFLDKTPRYYFILPELRRVFPNARFVFLVRNPLAVLASVIEIWAPQESGEVLRGFRHDLITAPRLIAEAIAGFGAEPSAGRHAATGGPAGFMGDAAGSISVTGESPLVRYEELAASPAGIIAKLCQQLDLPFEPAMIEYGSSAAGKERFLYGDEETVYQHTRPVADRVARWQATLDTPLRRAWARGYIEALGPATISALGYSYNDLHRAFPPQPGLENAWVEMLATSGVRRSAPA